MSGTAADRASSIFLRSGVVRRACLRGFWPIFFVRLVTDVELSPLQLVLLGTIMELTILLTEIPTGVVADLYSRKWSVVLSYLIGGPAFVLSAFVSDYWLLVIVQAAIGFAATFETGAETAWITDEVGSVERAEPLILRRAAWQMAASIAGIVVFGGAAAVLSLSTALALIGTIFFAWGLYLAVTMPETNFAASRGSGWSGFFGMLADGSQQCRRIAPLRILVTVIFIFGLAKEAIDRLDVQRLVDVGLPEDLDPVVIVAGVVALTSVVASGLLVIVRQRVSGRVVVPALSALFLGMAVGVALLAHMELLGLAAAGLVLQGGFAFTGEPLVTTWANVFASVDARATVHSFIGQAEAFGEIIGGVLLGALAEATTVPTAMTISAVLFAGGGLLASTARRHWDDALSTR